MRQLSATDAARRFSEVLDQVERSGETFTVLRRGRAVARISPAPAATGAALLDIVRRHPPDVDWAADLRSIREGLELEDRSWSG